jgi:putative phosphoserine phosphatase / 1-acylglycerol-3-phosphate O-acyltransferase
MDLDEVVDTIRTGPRGPNIGAFFDFDGTLVHGFSGVPFFRHFVRAGRLTPREIAGTMLSGIRGGKSEQDFARFIDLALSGWAGHTEAELETIGNQLFQKRIAGHLYPEAWRLIRAHEAAGHTLVIASSATRFQIEPAARALGIDNILCTPLEVVDGVLTGKVAGSALWRHGKAVATKEFAEAHGIDLPRSHTYSNGGEDVEFLSLVERPVAVNPDSHLATEAETRGWPTLRFKPRRSPGPVTAARTIAAIGGFAGAVVVGAGTGVVSRDSSRGRDRVIAHTGDYTLAMAGIDVRVVGEHNAREPRPAVFAFNHQSELDMFVLAKVLRDGFTGITKKELASDPLLGPVLRYMGATFVDRSNTAAAKEALRPVVDTLRGGLSIVIAPEGTRSITPSLGEFKKGAFHIAMQAGVPIIPVVIRNAGELRWRNGTAIRSGTVEVAVLDPIDVSDWSADDLNDRVAAVRQLFLDTLLDWPRA